MFGLKLDNYEHNYFTHLKLWIAVARHKFKVGEKNELNNVWRVNSSFKNLIQFFSFRFVFYKNG